MKLKASVFNSKTLLNDSPAKRLIPVTETESFVILSQKIDGEHFFEHTNNEHDEAILVLEGRLDVWTETEEFKLQKHDIFKIPKGLTHGNLVGHDAEILLLEGKI